MGKSGKKQKRCDSDTGECDDRSAKKVAKEKIETIVSPNMNKVIGGLRGSSKKSSVNHQMWEFLAKQASFDFAQGCGECGGF